jgi:DNA-binding transcriptional regulator YhcF (GntR family)
MLVDQGILYKKRGIGMFVSKGAREKLLEKRKAQFYTQHVAAIVREARKLGITARQLAEMILKGEDSQ